MVQTGGAGGVRRPEEAVRGQGLLQLPVGDAGLHPRQAVGGIDLQDAGHALQGEHDAALIRHRGPGGAGAAAPRHQRDALGNAQAHQFLHLALAVAKQTACRQGLAAAVVVAVGPAVGGVAEQPLGAEEGAQARQRQGALRDTQRPSRPAARPGCSGSCVPRRSPPPGSPVPSDRPPPARSPP
jgi:hypothetical protein